MHLVSPLGIAAAAYIRVLTLVCLACLPACPPPSSPTASFCLACPQVNSEEEALNYLFLGDTNRAISETAMNQV